MNISFDLHQNAEECLLKIVNNASDEALAEISGDPRDLQSIKNSKISNF
jgi:hypothetical protein